MRRIWYRTGFKNVNIILQGLLAGILSLCLLTVFYWTEGTFGITEMGKSFEESDAFLRQVEETVREKINYDRNRELFEENGELDLTQEVDIRQYASGITDDLSLNLNTTYYMQDLLDFYDNGLRAMESQIQRLTDSGLSDQEIGERLGELEELETVLPVSGSGLADYARMSVNPSTALLEYYQNLCETSRDIKLRYQQYLAAGEEPDGEENSQAPSNVRYYIENTNTKQRYTNMGVKSLTAARRLTETNEELVSIFEGERSFNIMVANSENVINDAASQWFMETRFLGSGEKVLLAVDLSYSIGDSLQEARLAYEQREPIVLGSVIAAAVSLLLLLTFFVLSVIAAGRREPGGVVVLNWADRIPTEIAAGLCLILALGWYLFSTGVRRSYLNGESIRQITSALIAAVEYWIFLLGFLSLIRRIKGRTLWDNSVCYAVALGCRQVYRAKKSSKRLLIAYVLFFALNFLFLGFLGIAGCIMALVLDMAVLLYLMRDVVGKQSVQEGLYQLSQGQLGYKIDTKVLTGESLEMAEAVNDMGDGLQEAVDAIIRNERLKAELITNVSHDIKTPLTSIINYVDLLKREKLENPRAQEYLQVLEQKSQRLRQLTEDLIEASKINSGNIELHKETLKVQQLLQQAYGEFAERMEEKKLEAVIRMEKDPLEILADGRQLWRIFENLFGNIVKYAMPGTRVYLEVTGENGMARIIFRNVSRQKLDISPEELQERFVRGDLSRSTEGSGLGLSIARSLTELMDGSFQIGLEGDSFRAELLFPLEGEREMI